MSEAIRMGTVEVNKRSSMFIYYICCLISAVLYSVTQSAILGIVTGAFICLLAFVTPEEDYYIFIFGLQFLRAVIRINIGPSSFGFILFVYICLLLKLMYKLYFRPRMVPVEYMIPIVFLILDVTVSVVAGVYKIGDNINWVCSLIYMINILNEKADKIDFEKLVVYFCLAEWAICLINIIAEYRIFGRSLVPSMYGTWTKELGAFAFGKAYPSVAGGNGIAFNNILAIALCILMFPRAKKFTTRFFYIATIILLGYCGIMVISRAFYVEIIIFLVLYALSLCRKPKRFIAFAVVLCLFAIVFYLFLYDDLFLAFDRVLRRFESGNAVREELIDKARTLLSKDVLVLLFGAGSYYPDIYKFTAHNIYWDSFVSLGIFGGIAYWAIIIKTVVMCIKKHAKLSIQAFIPLIMLFTYRIISGSTRDVEFYFFIAFATLYAVYYTRKENKKCLEDA